MRVIIPAAGIGSRLRPHTHTIPKSMLHVAGKPIIGHILDSIIALQPEELVLITGFLGEKIQAYVSEHYSFNIRFIEQQGVEGLGFAVHMGLAAGDDVPTLIILGDTIVEADLGAFTSGDENVLGLMPVDDPSRFGIADVSEGVVTHLVEKPAEPKSNMALIGLYYINDSAALKKRLADNIESKRRTRGEIQLTDALQGMIDDGQRFKAYSVDGWYDCGKRETLIATNRHLLDKFALNDVRGGSVIIPPTYIAPTARVESSVIGPHVSVSDGAVIKNSIIKNSIVGYEAEVNNVLLSDSLIGHKAAVSGEYRRLNVGDSSEVENF